MRYSSIALALTGLTLMGGVAACHRSPSSGVVATVNGKEIQRADLERDYQTNLSGNPHQLSNEEANIQRLSILRTLIEYEILQQHAAKVNLAASDEDVNSKLTEIKARFTQEEFDAQLKARNITIDDFKRDLRSQLTRTKLINKEIESKINITDSEIATYYNAHKAEFNLIEPQYHMAQIVVTTSPAQQPGNLQNNKASGDADAKKKILTLHNRLDSGEDFGGVAMNFSEDSNTASNGGDMGFVAESALHTDPEVYNAVNKLRPDQYTDVLPVYDGAGQGHRVVGYAIYKLIAREPAGQRELHDPRVQQTIHTLLHNNRAQLLQNAYLETLHNDAKVRNFLAEEILKQDGQ
jgi:peptidyl-prolyl cis-trans isomerase SurA